MSVVKSNTLQLGQSLTASQNFCWYQPSSPDGTVRLGNGNAGSVTDLVTVNSSGNVGIGTSSPVSQLNVNASTGGDFRLTRTSVGGGSSTLGSVSFGNQSSSSLSSILATEGGTTTSSILAFYTATGGTSSERMRLDTSGNLGLGVTPSASTIPTLEIGTGGFTFNQNGQAVGGAINSNAYYVSGVAKYKNTGYIATYYSQGNGGHGWGISSSGTAGNAISFTQAMTLDASGNLLVGTTTVNAKLYVVGTANSTCGRFEAASGNLIQCISTATSGTNNAIYFQQNATQVGSITTTNSATAYNTGSDQRLKTNVAPAGSAIQSILNFPVDQFDWISTGEHQDFGAVAQKAINVIPEMVTAPEDPEEMWGIDWSKAVPRLIKTLQELTAELNELKAKVNA